MTDHPTNFITFNSPPTEEVLRLDKKGFHYRGQFIADSGEAYRLMMDYLEQQTQPEPQGPTDEELDEFATYWWGPETDERTVSDVIECGSMSAFARAVLAIEPQQEGAND